MQRESKKINEITVDLSNPKNYSKIPTIASLTFFEGILIGHLLYLNGGVHTIEELLQQLPILESADQIKELRKQLSRKRIISVGPRGGIAGRPRGEKRGDKLHWTVLTKNLEKLL